MRNSEFALIQADSPLVDVVCEPHFIALSTRRRHVMRQPPSRSLRYLLVLVILPSPAHAQRAGWWATASGGVVNPAQSCPPGALSDSCGASPEWGFGTGQLAVGRALSRSLAVGLEVAYRRVTTEVDATRDSEAASGVAQVVAVVRPEPRYPLYLQVGLGGGRFRITDRFSQSEVSAAGPLWAVSVAVGAEGRLVGPLGAGPYLRLDYAEFAGVGDFFKRLHQRLVSFGVAVTVR